MALLVTGLCSYTTDPCKYEKLVYWISFFCIRSHSSRRSPHLVPLVLICIKSNIFSGVDFVSLRIVKRRMKTFPASVHENLKLDEFKRHFSNRAIFFLLFTWQCFWVATSWKRSWNPLISINVKSRDAEYCFSTTTAFLSSFKMQRHCLHKRRVFRRHFSWFSVFAFHY